MFLYCKICAMRDYFRICYYFPNKINICAVTFWRPFPRGWSCVETSRPSTSAGISWRHCPRGCPYGTSSRSRLTTTSSRNCRHRSYITKWNHKEIIRITQNPLWNLSFRLILHSKKTYLHQLLLVSLIFSHHKEAKTPARGPPMLSRVRLILLTSNLNSETSVPFHFLQDSIITHRSLLRSPLLLQLTVMSLHPFLPFPLT